MKEQETKMNKAAIIISLIIAMAVGLCGCVTVSPLGETAPTTESEPAPATTTTTTGTLPPPVVPPEVLSIWKSEPAWQAYPPDISGEVTLLPNSASGERVERGDISIEVFLTRGARQESVSFYLDECQWMDVIVSSVDTPIYYLTEKRGALSFHPVGWTEVDDKPRRNTLSQDMSIFRPFYGRLLYENRITSTDKSTVFTSAARIFAWTGEGRYFIEFYNLNRQKGSEVAYRVYKDGTTPGWGKAWEQAKLQPWLNELYYLLVSGKITEEEYDEAESKWLEQFEVR